MTKLFEMAVDAVRELTPQEQDEIGRLIFDVVSNGEAEPVPLTAEQADSIRISKEQAAQGEFASDAEIEAIWAKYT